MRMMSSRRAGWAVAVVLLGSLGLAACGATSTSTATSPAGGSTTTSATPTPAPATGCPLPTQAVQRPPADVVVRPLTAEQPVDAKVGQTIEVQLPFGHKWALFPLATTIVSLQSPAGYGDASVQSCIWRFTATAAGNGQLVYLVSPICQTGVECPNYMARFTIDLHITS
jgi:hypothetical protein